ncbi:MAG: cyclic nucleotide-binding domain-containing protein [Bacteroidia bacterium]|nr:MAG: cyclic nucleotide-binding domain-containing protein [Bacteroidia bacterium]
MNLFISKAGRVERKKSIEMLRQLSWLSRLEEKEFKVVAKRFRIKTFSQGAILLKEQEPDNGLFMIVKGEVKIEIRDILMGTAGTGSVLGEMAFLTGHPRTATVVAESSVQVLWIKRAALRSIMRRSPQLENGLWEFASMRFAMNLLGKKEPYSLWEQNRFIQWLSAGEVKLPNENGWMDLGGKVGVLVIGTAAQHDGSTVVKAPCTLTGTDYIFSKEARVFLRDP